MSFFKDILQLWRSEDLLAQAWDESCEMLKLSQDMFIESVKHLRQNEDKSVLQELKKRDWEINAFQKTVRRKVFTHYTVIGDRSDITNGLILVNIVIDIERVGDYAKNIVELALNHPEHLISEDLSDDLHFIEQTVHSRFAKTVEAIESQNIDIAKSLKASYKHEVSKISDNIVNAIISGDLQFGAECTTASIALYARYLKRIGSHLNNIATSLVNPFDTIGYAQ